MNDVIEHHGVKGQKWGVRRRRVMAAAERVGATASSLTGAVVSIGGGKSGSKFRKLSRGLRNRADRNEAKANKIQAKTAAKASKLINAKRSIKVAKANRTTYNSVKGKTGFGTRVKDSVINSGRSATHPIATYKAVFKEISNHPINSLLNPVAALGSKQQVRLKQDVDRQIAASKQKKIDKKQVMPK